MKKIFTVVLASTAAMLMSSAGASAQTGDKARQPAAHVEAQALTGGVSINLPGPTGNFVEVGDNLRSLFALLVGGGSRLLTAYLPAEDLAGMSHRPTNMEVYAMVEVDKETENMQLSANEFREMLKDIEPEMDAGTLQDAQQQLNHQLGTLATSPIELGQPQMLGRMFQKDDATGFGMLEAVKHGGLRETMVAGFALVRVKQHIVLAYLFHKYDSPDAVRWVRTTLDSWSDGILASNR